MSTAKTYTLEASDKQAAYDQLKDIADSRHDAPVTLGVKSKNESLAPDSLTDVDIILFMQAGSETAGITVSETGTKKKFFLSHSEMLKFVYAELCRQDKDRDGAIDEAFLHDDLVIPQEIPAAPLDAARARKEIIERYKQSVFAVKVTLDGPDPEGWEGTAFVHKRIDNGDGTYTYHVITNAHVADDETSAEKDFTLIAIDDSSEFTGVKRVGVDHFADIAVLEFTAPVKLEACPFVADEDAPGLGDETLTFGNTLGDGVIPLSGTVVDLSFGMGDMGGGNYPFAILKTTSHAAPGNSGSAVFNLDGAVVGVHFMGTDPDMDGLIPAAQALKSYEKIIADRESGGVTYSYWGVEPVALAQSERAALLPADKNASGVLVSKVYPGSPAQKAGLIAGDIVLSVDRDASVASAANEDDLYPFHAAMLESKPGKKRALEIYRPGVGRMTVNLVPVSRLYEPAEVYETSYDFNAVEITDDRRDKYGIPAAVKGVWACSRNSGYFGLETFIVGGLYHGDVILDVNGKSTPDVESFGKAFESAEASGKPVILKTYKTAYSYSVADGGNGAVNYVTIQP